MSDMSRRSTSPSDRSGPGPPVTVVASAVRVTDGAHRAEQVGEPDVALAASDAPSPATVTRPPQGGRGEEVRGRRGVGLDR